MATKFSVWVDTPSTGSNVQDQTTFNNDTQRANGFVAGDPASAIRMNTALREATLITTAFMDAIAPDSNVDVTSSVAQIKTLIQSALGSSISSITFNSTSYVLTITSTDGTSATVDLSAIKSQTSARATGDADGNNIVQTYATKAELTQAVSNINSGKLYLHENVVFRYGSSTGDYKIISFITWKDETGLYDESNPQPTYISFETFLGWRPFDIYISDSWDGGFSETETFPAFILPKWNYDSSTTRAGIAYMPITSGTPTGTASLEVITALKSSQYLRIEYNTNGDSIISPYKEFSPT